MKNKVGLIIAVLMLLFGAYALSIALSTSGAHIILMSNHEIPRELVLMFGFICGKNPDREVGDEELPESSWLGMVRG